MKDREFMTVDEKARAFENIRVEWYKYLAHLEEDGRIATSRRVEDRLEYEFTCGYHRKIHSLMYKDGKTVNADHSTSLHDKSEDMLQFLLQRGDITMLDVIHELERRKNV